jgi:hypothetical protein
LAAPAGLRCDDPKRRLGYFQRSGYGRALALRPGTSEKGYLAGPPSVDGDPANTLLPSGSVTRRALAMLLPSLAA